MFEKIISKNTGDAAPRTPSAPHPEPAPAVAGDANRPVAISAGQRNVLGSDVKIEGEVRFQNALIADGRIEGKIVSEGVLTIGESAHIKAEITCGTVIVHGRVAGNITVTDRVEICANAEVIGDIRATALSMEAGAVFVGASTIGSPRTQTKVDGKSGDADGKKPGAEAVPELAKAPAA